MEYIICRRKKAFIRKFALTIFTLGLSFSSIMNLNTISQATESDEVMSIKDNQYLSQSLPEGFILVSDVVPDAIQEIRYYSTYNFVGERIDAYKAPVAILSKKAAEALKKASDDFISQGYYIKIFDAYRPQSAANHFIRWSQDKNDIKMKPFFYPDVNKEDLFDLGYIVAKSSHSRGSTLDMTIVDAKTGKEVDTGSPFDLFDEVSHHDSNKITSVQRQNREIIKATMERNGFNSYQTEWWHYTLRDEPYPDTYFDFPVGN